MEKSTTLYFFLPIREIFIFLYGSRGHIGG
nr:MAG TPA: hypothetical protein [Caudoviricetes sp.]